MRTGLITSAVGHLVLLLCALISPSRMQTAHGDTVAVELVSPAEFARATKDEKGEPGLPAAAAAAPSPPPAAAPSQAPPTATAAKEQSTAQPKQATKPTPTASPPAKNEQAQAQAQPQPQPQQQQQQPLTPPTPLSQTTPPTTNISEMPADPQRLAAMLHLPLNGTSEGFGSEAESGAKLTRGEIAAFKAHLRSCWSLPPGISESQKVKVVVRVSLKPDGTLATAPMLIEASASAMGPPLVQNAMRALKECAPYTMLPAEKYKEWKVLDLNFSPDAMAGG